MTSSTDSSDRLGGAITEERRGDPPVGLLDGWNELNALGDPEESHLGLPWRLLVVLYKETIF